MTGEPPARLQALAERVHAVGRALQQGDEATLAAEATLLSRMTPLPMPSTLNAVRIRAERDPDGRAA